MCMQGILIGKAEGRRTCETLHTDTGIKIELVLKQECVRLYFILLAQGMDWCHAVVVTVMKFRVL